MTLRAQLSHLVPETPCAPWWVHPHPWLCPALGRGGFQGWQCSCAPCFSALWHLCEQNQGCVCPAGCELCSAALGSAWTPGFGGHKGDTCTGPFHQGCRVVRGRMGAARGRDGGCRGRSSGMSCGVLGEPSNWGAGDTRLSAAQPQLPGHGCQSWGCLGHLPGVRAGPGEAPAPRSRSPCLGFACSRAIKGSVGRALGPGISVCWGIPESSCRQSGLGTAAIPWTACSGCPPAHCCPVRVPLAFGKCPLSP